MPATIRSAVTTTSSVFSTGSSNSFLLNGAPQSGDKLIAVLTWDDAGNTGVTYGISDSLNGAWTPDAVISDNSDTSFPTNNTHGGAIFSINCASGWNVGSTQVTVAATQTKCQLTVAAFSGVAAAAVDQVATHKENTSPYTATTTALTGTLATADELAVYAWASNTPASVAPLTAAIGPNGSEVSANIVYSAPGGSGYGYIFGYLNLSATTPVDGTMTCASNAFSGTSAIAAYKNGILGPTPGTAAETYTGAAPSLGANITPAVARTYQREKSGLLMPSRKFFLPRFTPAFA